MLQDSDDRMSRKPRVKTGRNLRHKSISMRCDQTEFDLIHWRSKNAKLRMGSYVRAVVLGQSRPPIAELNQRGLTLLGESTECLLRLADGRTLQSRNETSFNSEPAEREFLKDLERARALLLGALGPEAIVFVE
jgi:hypothetical protein